MTTTLKTLLDDALQLSDHERAEFAAYLIESLDEGADEDVDAAWAEVIERRKHELDSGQVSPVPWSKAREIILAPGDAASSN